MSATLTPDRAKELLDKIFGLDGNDEPKTLDELLERITGLGAAIPGLTDEVEGVSLMKIRAKSAKELKGVANKHLIHYLIDNDILERTYYARAMTKELMPFDVFVVQRLQGKLVAGSNCHVSMFGDDEDGKVAMAIESYDGVALEVMVDDLEDDGYSKM